MLTKLQRILIWTLISHALVNPGFAEEVYRVRLFFGLSLPGGGAVSLQEWQDFQDRVVATAFDGFNVADSIGIYKGNPERSKVLTLIVSAGDMPKVKAIARTYGRRFRQDSVMMVKIPVAEWIFISPSD